MTHDNLLLKHSSHLGESHGGACNTKVCTSSLCIMAPPVLPAPVPAPSTYLEKRVGRARRTHRVQSAVGTLQHKVCCGLYLDGLPILQSCSVLLHPHPMHGTCACVLGPWSHSFPPSWKHMSEEGVPYTQSNAPLLWPHPGQAAYPALLFTPASPSPQAWPLRLLDPQESQVLDDCCVLGP